MRKCQNMGGKYGIFATGGAFVPTQEKKYGWRQSPVASLTFRNQFLAIAVKT